MAQESQVYTEIELTLPAPPRELPVFRGRSMRDLAHNLRRESRRVTEWFGGLASFIEGLAEDGWRWRSHNDQALVFYHHQPRRKRETSAYLQRKFGRSVLRRVALRERVHTPAGGAGAEHGAREVKGMRPPRLPKADDELTRELRRLIGSEEHREELYLGHPNEELGELLLDMSFLAQEALEDAEVSAMLHKLQEEHAADATYRDLHGRYLGLLDRLGSGDAATEETYWDLFSYTASRLSTLVPV
ncbi:MAG: hypothetical protein HY660_12275, partial [Armatimonadetes bacterium]|nr:hypothetical protein [Armatimonadota bacterium]